MSSNFLIFAILTKNIHSHRSKHINTKNNINSLAKNPAYLKITQYMNCQKICQTIIENNLNKSNANKKTNITIFVISTQYLQKRNNSCINIIKSQKKN